MSRHLRAHRRTLMRSLPLALLLTAGCQGIHSRKPPVHLNPNMDQQARFDAQEPDEFFADGRAMRMPVEGTVALGTVHEDTHFYEGKVVGEFAEELPGQLDLDAELLQRGQQRFDIACRPCHDAAGTGQGTVVQRGYPAPPSLHDDRVRAMPIGQLYSIITNGGVQMPAYGPQLRVRDRWAVAAYVRALQVSRSRTLQEVPADIASEQGWR